MGVYVSCHVLYIYLYGFVNENVDTQRKSADTSETVCPCVRAHIAPGICTRYYFRITQNRSLLLHVCKTFNSYREIIQCLINISVFNPVPDAVLNVAF